MTRRPLVLAFAALAGCLNVPDGEKPMCKSNNDCDRASGEVCEEGVCWGNPPPGPFAAVVSPPSARRDLVSRELPQVAIPDYGWMGDLVLEAPVLLTGRIVPFCPPPTTGCDSTLLGGTITISRRTQFHGGPGFNIAVNVDAGSSFSIPLPRTHAGDDPYTVTVVPDGGMQAGSGSAEQVPPLRTQLSIVDNTSKTLALGGASLPVLSGTLRDSNALGLAGYRVVALGHWDPNAAPTEVSTVDFTGANGGYAVTLSESLVGTVEIVAKPPAGVVAPTIHIANIDATRSSPHDVTTPVSLGRAILPPPLVTVSGLNLSGSVSPVRGAEVSVVGTFTPPNSLVSYTISDDQVTDGNGRVGLHLLDGLAIAGSYRLSITPPASSNLGVVFDQKLVAVSGDGPAIRLPSRVAVHGRVTDALGHPLANVAVTARPSLRFLWTLDDAPQAFVASIPAATAVTPESTSGTGAGRFVVWVDPNVAQVWGHYDLLIEPPATARAPSLLKTDVEIVRDSTLDTLQLGDVTLPDAAYVHGRITGPDGQAVENAELRLYRVSAALTLCSEVAHAPLSCPIPALLQGRNTSDNDGIVRLTLPR